MDFKYTYEREKHTHTHEIITLAVIIFFSGRFNFRKQGFARKPSHPPGNSYPRLDVRTRDSVRLVLDSALHARAAHCAHIPCAKTSSKNIHTHTHTHTHIYIYISTVRRVGMYSPNYLRIGVLNSLPTPRIQTWVLGARCSILGYSVLGTRVLGSADCSWPLLPSSSLPFPRADDAAHLHGMHSYEIDHSSSDFSTRQAPVCIPCCTCVYI